MSDVEPEGDSLEDTGRHPLYRSFESRRAYPRVRLRMPVRIGLKGGRVVCANIYNMSPDGIQIRCDRATARSIHPAGKKLREGAGPEVMVAMRLKAGGDLRTHMVRCRLSYILPQDTDVVVMGFEFREVLPAQREAIDAVLGASLEPREG